jgi:hypothetical protein
MRGTGKWDVVNLFEAQTVGDISRQFLPHDYVDEHRELTSWAGQEALKPTSYGLPDDELLEVEIYK